MKRLIISLCLLVLCSFTVSADPFATFECADGKVDVLGCEVVNNDGKDCVAILMNLTNTSGDSYAPWSEFSITAYQDGIQLSTAYVSERVYKPAGYENEDTKIRPNGLLPFYKTYELRNTVSPVEIEISESFSFSADKAECTLALGVKETGSESNYSATAPAVAATPSTTVSISELLARIEALEQRVAALEAGQTIGEDSVLIIE